MPATTVASTPETCSASAARYAAYGVPMMMRLSMSESLSSEAVQRAREPLDAPFDDEADDDAAQRDDDERAGGVRQREPAGDDGATA